MRLPVLFGQANGKTQGEIKYLSHNSYYVNLGTAEGLQVGDTLVVKRRQRIVGRLAVENVARVSAACRLLSQTSTLKEGDSVELLRLQLVREDSNSQSVKKRNPEGLLAQTREASSSRSGQRRRRQVSSNTIKGRFSVQTLTLDDQTTGNRDYYQLGLRSKLKVDRFMGLPAALRVRWRSRLHHRGAPGGGLPMDEWRHSVYELGLVSSDDGRGYEFGIGRISSSRIRGVGFIDGGLFSLKLSQAFRAGVAGGAQPSLRNSNFQTKEKKFGLFLAFEKGDFSTQRFASTVALSGRYHVSQVSREFVYIQNNYSLGSKFSLYQTLEVDVNRGWKNDLGQKKFQLSNTFFSASVHPAEFVSFNFSYDARKSVRVFETRSIPDSLFDETTRKGFHSGVTLRLPRRIRLSGTFGIRFRKGALKNTTSSSAALTVPRVLGTPATVNARLSYFNTMFTKAYRPTMSLRLPVSRRFFLNTSAGSYIYQTGSVTTTSTWLEATGYFRIDRKMFLNAGYRRFLDQRLKSARLVLEVGVLI